jgi:hypothetical protein
MPGLALQFGPLEAAAAIAICILAVVYLHKANVARPEERVMVKNRRTITNHTDRLMLVWTEPIAEDYWLEPGETMETESESLGDDCVFEVSENEWGVTVGAARGMDFCFREFQGDVELKCGHQRPDWWK